MQLAQPTYRTNYYGLELRTNQTRPIPKLFLQKILLLHPYRMCQGIHLNLHRNALILNLM